MAQQQIPSERALGKTRWTLEKAKSSPFVTFRGDKAFIGERELIFPGQEEEVIAKVYKTVPPTVGYLRLDSVIRQRYVGIKRDILRKWLAEQEVKQLHARVYRPSIIRAQTYRNPGVKWQADLVRLTDVPVNEGNFKYAVTIIDGLSKFLVAVPVKTESASEVIRATKKWLEELERLDIRSKVRVLQTDNGPGWTSQEFQDFLKEQGIKNIRTTPFRPMGNGQIERANQTLRGYLDSWSMAKYGRRSAWPKVLKDAVLAVNTSWNRILKGKTPEQVLLGESLEMVRERIRQEAATRRNSRVYKNRVFQPGDKVRLSLRISGDSRVQSQIKQGIRKASLPGWSKEIYTIENRRGESYTLEEAKGLYDAADLLLVPDGRARPYSNA